MTITLLGVNHKTASLALRETLAFNTHQIPALLSDLLARETVSQALILSTCNRTEIIIDAQTADPIREMLTSNTPITLAQLNEHAYVYQDHAAVEHLMQVACGLDSMVLGEPQILGQVKSAVNIAMQQKALGPIFHELCQSVFSLAKRVRSTTEIGICPMSIASMAVKLASQVLDSISETHALLVGAGDTMRLVAKHLAETGVKQITIASRNIENAQRIAGTCDGTAMCIRHLASHLPKADIVMSATASELPIIGKGMVETSLLAREAKPMLFVDMAVPRDIEAGVGDLDGAHLYTIDDLKQIARENVQVREHAAFEANRMIEEESAKFCQWLQSRESIDIIRSFRASVERLREAELAKALQSLSAGGDPEALLRRFANDFANKVMHKPSATLNKASLAGREDVLQAAIDLFALDEQE
jgi:glutamyl-tRNA reductase